MFWLDRMVSRMIAFSRGERAVFCTFDQRLHWQVLQLLADHGVWHRGAVRYEKKERRRGRRLEAPRVRYEIFVRKRDFSYAMGCIDEKRGSL